MNQNKIVKSFQFGQHEVRLETGRMAKQASSVLASMGDTVVLATAVGKQDSPPMSFLPLTIDYEERTYAAGKIPGGFFKREGRPSEKAILTCRLIDRPMRPLFPKGFRQEVQVVITVLSLDPEINADIVAMLAASAAVQISGIPFDGPVGACRVGFVDGQYVLNPSKSILENNSKLDLVVAGTADAILMVESEAQQLSEQEMLGAVMFGHESLGSACQAIKELGEQVNPQMWDWTAPEIDEELVSQVQAAAMDEVKSAYQIAEKTLRQNKIRDLRESLLAKFSDENEDESKSQAIKTALSGLEKKLVRDRIIAGEARIDGRNTTTVRPIEIELGILPRAHGSALFTRGETQALVVTTLGTERDAQIIDALDGDRKQPFMLHYNFPPYCVGEVGRVGSPKRREIGHGNLARRGVAAVLPKMEEFPYTLRVVSEITESNGSSSMASVCGTSLSLMDAGVSIDAPVAGVAMGLIKEGDNYSVLTDILGDEDHLGDMDFKVAGTQAGVTALQMDIKIQGITREIMESALAQARDGRLHILDEMSKCITQARAEMSEYAPRIITIKIPTDKIRDVIGKGGATIRAISEETGVTIDIDDDGTVRIASVDNAAGLAAKTRIEEITADVEVGKIYNGRVVKLMDFGAFVNILPGRDGLLHISQISNDRVEKVSDKVKEGQMLDVKVLEVDKQGRIRLSVKAISDNS